MKQILKFIREKCFVFQSINLVYGHKKFAADKKASSVFNWVFIDARSAILSGSSWHDNAVLPTFWVLYQ